MVMDTIQIRISHETVGRIDRFIKSGQYSSRSDVIRDAVRRFVWEKEVGSIPNDGKDSVKEIRKIRKRLSKEIRTFEDLQRMDKELEGYTNKKS